jgi:hypothetical protein
MRMPQAPMQAHGYVMPPKGARRRSIFFDSIRRPKDFWPVYRLWRVNDR